MHNSNWSGERFNRVIYNILWEHESGQYRLPAAEEWTGAGWVKEAMTGRLERGRSVGRIRELSKITELQVRPRLQIHTPTGNYAPFRLMASGTMKVQAGHQSHPSCFEPSCPIQFSTVPVPTPPPSSEILSQLLKSFTMLFIVLR